MLKECETYHDKKKSKGGKPNKLSVSTRILLMLEYYREYRSMAHMAFDYEVSESTVSRTIKEIETVLLQSGKFSLPSKKALYENDGIDLQYILIDAAECPVERPKKQRMCYSGKKKQHTVKGQVVIDANLRIICTSIAMTNTHDFKLYKQSRLPLPQMLKVCVDEVLLEGIQDIWVLLIYMKTVKCLRKKQN